MWVLLFPLQSVGYHETKAKGAEADFARLCKLCDYSENSFPDDCFSVAAQFYSRRRGDIQYCFSSWGITKFVLWHHITIIKAALVQCLVTICGTVLFSSS